MQDDLALTCSQDDLALTSSQDDLTLTSSQELPLSQEYFSDIFYDSQEQLSILDNEDLNAVFDKWRDGLAGQSSNAEPSKPETARMACSSQISEPGMHETADPCGNLETMPLCLLTHEMLVTPATSCLPATNNWAGDYGFELWFPCEERVKGIDKKITWTYSSIRDKLYVIKSVPCPLNFVTNEKLCRLPTHLELRVQAVFDHPEHSSEIVSRCPNHRIADEHAGLQSSNHLIRCECASAKYSTDPKTGQYSVVVPFESPQMGQAYSTYIFKFSCFSSCAGGLNRRPIKMMFTLENRGEVVGRRTLPVKICACPSRDSKTDDKPMKDDKPEEVDKKKKVTASRKRKSEPLDLTGILVNQLINKVTEFGKKSNCPTEFGKKSNCLPNKDGNYVTTTKDRACHEFLRQSKQMFELDKTMRQLDPNTIALLRSVKKLKKETDTDTASE